MVAQSLVTENAERDQQEARQILTLLLNEQNYG